MAIRSDILPSSAERFWRKVNQVPNGCWEWTAAKTEKGYGVFGIGKETDKAHRIAWRLLKGSLPEGLILCHTCDNPGCVNPDHLFAGTHQDNHDDAVKKGRASTPPPRGGWNKKEVPSAVLDLLGKEADTTIGQKFNLSKSVIQRCRRALGIKPFPSQTQFKAGDPHPRWARIPKGE